MREYWIGSGLYPILNAYINSNARVSIIDGPLGSGKTTASCQRILRHMVEQEPNANGVRPTRILVCRNTYPDLLSTTAETFRAFFFPEESSNPEEPLDPTRAKLPSLGRWYGGGEEPPQAAFEFAQQDGTVVKCAVLFLALDRPNDIRRLLGIEFTWIYLSECKELEKPIIDMLDLRHGRYPSERQGGVTATYRGMFGDTNKPDTEHWLYELSENVKPVGWEFFHQPGGLVEDPRGRDADGRKRWLPNPLAENLDGLKGAGGMDYYTSGQQGKRDDWISVYLANEYGFVAGGKPVHPDYVDSIHAAEEVLEAQPRLPLVLGFDFGRTPACVVLQWWPGIGRWAAIAEFTSDDMSAATFGPQCRAWLGREFPGFDMRGWGDPAGDHKGQTIDETPMMILRSHGIPCQPAPTNDPLLRRSALAGPLTRGTLDGRRAFVISPRCTLTRKGLQGAWDFPRINKIGVELYSDLPAKNRYSHPCEALEYALAGEGEAQQAIQPAASRYGRDAGSYQDQAEM